MIKISVIVPVFNVEKRLNKCLDSLVNQTFKELEIIIINDGSTDNSINIINDYKKKYDNITVIDRENKGISETRNEGIKIAKGKYIAFLDSDDYIELDMYEKLYSEIIRNDSDICLCDIKIIENENITILDLSKKCSISNIYDSPSMIYKIDYGPCNKLFKKELWNNIEFPNTKYEDLEAVLKVFLQTKKVCYVNALFYNYVQNTGGETKTIDKRVYDIFSILNNLYEEFKDKPKPMKKAFRELYVSKVFIYNHMILNTKNSEFSLEFIEKGYKSIKTNFKIWRIAYILKSRSFKNLIFRVLQTNKWIYKKYILYRTR